MTLDSYVKQLEESIGMIRVKLELARLLAESPDVLNALNTIEVECKAYRQWYRDDRDRFGANPVPTVPPRSTERECPFCGSTEVRAKVTNSIHGVNLHWAVECQTCDAMGPKGDTEQEAAELWSAANRLGIEGQE